jgi:HAMP domain-containing protein
VKPIFITPQSDKVVSGYTLINDVYGNPALILRVDDLREAFIQAKTSISYLGWTLLSIGIVSGLVTMLVLEKMVITRLTSLNSSVMKIGSQGTASSRVETNGNDEIFALATSLNSMLDSLQDSRPRVGPYSPKPNHRSGPGFGKVIFFRLFAQAQVLVPAWTRTHSIGAALFQFRISGMCSQ